MITAIHQHFSRLRLDQQQIRDEDLKSILTNIYNDFQKYGVVNGALTSDNSLTAMHLFCKHMIESQVYKNILRPQIIDHELFSLMGNTMLFILQKTNKCTAKDNRLTDLNWNVFYAMASVLTSSLPLNQFEDENLNKIVRKTFFNEKFLTGIKQCIESLLLNNYQNDQTKCRILNYVFEHVYFHSKACKGSLRSLLLDSVVQCIVSKVYTDQFSKNDELSADFLLFDCPHFVLLNSAHRHEEIANLLCQPLLKNYKNILSYRRIRKHGDSQRNEYLSSYVKLLNHCAMIESTRDMFTQYLPFIIIQLFATFNEYLCLDGEAAINYIKDEVLVAAILTLLYNLIPNSSIHAIIKENAPMSILSLLCDTRQQQVTTNGQRKTITIPKTIQFSARSLVALTTEDVDQLDQSDEVISLFLTYLTIAVKNDSQMHEGVHASRLLTSVTAIAQNDQVKEQIVERGALKLLSDCVYHPIVAVDKIQQPALYAIWTVSFNVKACLVWKTDEKLVTRLQEIFKSGSFDQQKVADGILWRLINEEKFRAEQLNVQRMLDRSNGKIQSTTYKDDSVWVKLNNGIVVLRDKLTQEQSEMIATQQSPTSNLQMKTNKPYKYDLMISYSHNNSNLCNIIYNCLLKMGKYNIWIDKEEMHGSMMERMAEAIEDSHLMLICMSSTYRSSPACQAECEYAFSRQNQVVFLKMEPKYKPSGWLGFYLGSKYYIDITKEDYLTKFKELVKQISIQRDEIPDYDLIDTIVTTDVQTAVTNALKAKDKTNYTAAAKSRSASSDKILPSGDIHQSTPLSSLSYLNQMKSSIIISPDSPGKTTTYTASSEQKICNTDVPLPSNTKEILNIESSLLSASTVFMPSTGRSAASNTDLQEINSKQDSPISSRSVLFSFDKSTSILDSQNKIKEECFTSEKLAKYYPSSFDYGNAIDNQDSLNDFALKIQTPSIPNLPDDEYGTDRQVASCNPFRFCLLLLRSLRNTSSNE